MPEVNRKGRKTDGLYYALHRVFFSSLPVAQDFTSSRPNCQAFQSGVEVKLRECDLPPQGVLWGGEREREREPECVQGSVWEDFREAGEAWKMIDSTEISELPLYEAMDC
jgi:hypothetical protein